MSIGSGVLLPGLVEFPTFPILRPLAYTTGLGYRPTCDRRSQEFVLGGRVLDLSNFPGGRIEGPMGWHVGGPLPAGSGEGTMPPPQKIL